MTKEVEEKRKFGILLVVALYVIVAVTFTAIWAYQAKTEATQANNNAKAADSDAQQADQDAQNVCNATVGSDTIQC